MNELLGQFAADPWGRLILHSLATGGVSRCFRFLLVIGRLTGVFVVAPQMVTTCIIPLPARAGLVLLLSLILAPVLPFDRPDNFTVIPVNDVSLPFDFQSDLGTELVYLISSEIALGTLLGIGVLTVLNGLRLGAEWIERASGLGLGSLLNPELSAEDSSSLRIIPLLGLTCFLLVEPLGGQWLLLRSLAESFHAIPVGTGARTTMTIELFNRLVQQSLVLGIRVAIPLVLTMLIVEITVSFAGRNTPVAIGSAAMAAKAGLGLFLMTLTLTAIPEVMTTSIMVLLE